MARVVHFEFPSSNTAASCKFYESVLGWKITGWEGPQEYWLVTTGADSEPGINGAIYPLGNGMTGTVNVVDVADIDDVLARTEANGGQVIMPKSEIPGVGLLAYIQEPGGNIFGVMQAAPDAAM